MKIGLLDHMGYGNLGDAATQEALIANIRSRLPDAEIVGFSLNPVDTTKRHGIESWSITYWHPGLGKSGLSDSSQAGSSGADSRGADSKRPHLRARLKSIAKNIPVVSRVARRLLHAGREAAHLGRSYRRLRSLDALIIAGGGQLSELWGGPWSHPYNVFKFSLLTTVARRKLVFANVGAGPLKSGLSRAFVRWSIRMADYVSFRDAESQELACGSGVKRQTHVFPDSAYALDVSKYAQDVSRYASGSRTSSAKPLVGLNPIGFCDPRIWPKKDAAVYESYIGKLADFSVWLLNNNYDLRLYSAEASVDIYAIEDLGKCLRSRLSAAELDRICRPSAGTVSGLMAEMSGFDFVVTAKFHGVVFSHLLAKPVIALSYHPKIDDLMRKVGHSQYCLDIATFDNKGLENTFVALVNDSEQLKARFRRTAASYSETLKTQFDGLFAPGTQRLRSRTPESERNEAVAGGPA
jgi:polysaccharide pyruvyl transferase WcaK-like protein